MNNHGFNNPHPNKFEDTETVINRISTEFGMDAEKVPISGINLIGVKRDIPVEIYKTGNVYHILAYNSSLELYYKMLQAVLDEEQESEFSELYNKIEYQEMLELLVGNTF